MRKRILSALLSIAMLATMLPVSAFADEANQPAEASSTSQEAATGYDIATGDTASQGRQYVRDQHQHFRC